MGMQILYKNKTAEKQFSSKYKKNWKYPEQVKRKLEAAENFIKSSSSLLDIVNYPPFHFHGLHGNHLISKSQMKQFSPNKYTTDEEIIAF